MRKKLSIIMIVLFLFAAVSPVYAATKKMTLYVGDTKKVSGNNWKSSKKTVASVNKKGVIKAKKPGKATITAKVKGKTQKWVVTVKTRQFKLSQKTKTLSIGETLTLKTTPKNAKAKWKTSNNKVATVSQKGVVTAKGEGTAVITASSGKKKSSCTITVKSVRATKIRMSAANTSLKSGDSVQFEIEVTPSNANRAFKWKSSNPAIAKVSNTGLVTAVAPGTAKISATTTDGSNLTISMDILVRKVEATVPTTPIPNAPAEPSVTPTQAPIPSQTPAVPSQAPTASVTPTATPTQAPVVPVLPTAAPTQTPEPTQSENRLMRIEAYCSLDEVADISEITADTISVYGVYDNNEKRQIGSFSSKITKKDGAYYITVTADGMVTTISVRAKEKPAPTLTGIEASCKFQEVEAGHNFTTDDFNVFGVYSDGSTASVGFSVDISAKDGYYVAVVKSNGFEKQISVKIKPTPTQVPETPVSIEAACSLSEASSASEITVDTITVYGVYPNGERKPIEAFSTKAVLQNGNYIVTVTAQSLTTTITIPAKKKSLTDIEASCKFQEVDAGYDFTTDDFDVIGVYSDGSKSSIGFSVDIAPKDGFYVATVKSNGFEKEIRIRIR